MKILVLLINEARHRNWLWLNSATNQRRCRCLQKSAIAMSIKEELEMLEKSKVGIVVVTCFALPLVLDGVISARIV